MNWPHSAISAVVADAGPLIALGKLGRQGLVPNAASLIEQLRTQGYWFSDSLVAQAIATADDSR